MTNLSNVRLLGNKDELKDSNAVVISSSSTMPHKNPLGLKKCGRTFHSFVAICIKNRLKVIFLSFCIVVVITFFLLTCAPTCILGPSYSTPISIQRSDEQYNVILYGDSLITGNHNQLNNFDLMVRKIKSFLPNHNVNLMNFAKGGQGISSMRSWLNSVLETPADAVILLWDSDVSANDESEDNISILREAYVTNLEYVMNMLHANKTDSKVAVAGPIILGEGTLFSRVSLQNYHGKQVMLDAYRSINQRIVADHNATYIDLRKAYLDFLPSYRLGYEGCLTVDGEHENSNGLTIISKLLAKTISDWIQI